MRSPFQIGSIGSRDRGENELIGKCYPLSDDRFLTVDCGGYLLQESTRGIATLHEYRNRCMVNELRIPLEVVLLLRDCQKSKVIDEFSDNHDLWGTYAKQERDSMLTLAFWRESDTDGIVLFPEEFQALCEIVERIPPHKDKDQRTFEYRPRKAGKHVRFLRVRGELKGKTWVDSVEPGPATDEYGRRRGTFNWLIPPMAVSLSSRIDTPCYLFGTPSIVTTVAVPEIDEGGIVFAAHDKRRKWTSIGIYLNHYKDLLWCETFYLTAGDVTQINGAIVNRKKKQGCMHEKAELLRWLLTEDELILTCENPFEEEQHSFHLTLQEWQRLVLGTKEIEAWFHAAQQSKDV